jgi:hypothetical protein
LHAKPNAEPSEDDQQRWLCRWLFTALGHYGWFHVPNGGWRRKATAAIMKALGVKPGVPDIIITRRAPRAPEARGVAVELKREKGGRTSAEQKAWIAELEADGWIAFVADGWTEARERLMALGFGR